MPRTPAFARIHLARTLLAAACATASSASAQWTVTSLHPGVTSHSKAFGWDTYKKVLAEYRALPASERPKSDAQKRDQWMVRFSRACGKNLGPFFQAWGVPTSEEARASIAGLPEWMPADWPGR
jgi:hypothetical protein